MSNSNLYNFLSRQIQQNRIREQSTELVKKVESIANKYLTKIERKKFYEENYKDISATKLKITLDK